jgi:probable phosphoglycerate mutase
VAKHASRAGPTDEFGGPAFALPEDAQLWIVRHGETEWSRDGRHTGRTDLPLLPEGEAQARAVQKVLAGIDPSLVLVSPRQRARRTAELAGLRIDDVDPDLAEWDYGDYEGITTAVIRQSVPDWTVFTHPCPGGERIEQVSRRADRVIARVLGHWQDGGDGPVVLVSHGHFSRVLGARWIEQPAEFGARLVLGTAAPSLLGADKQTPAIVHWNMPNPAEGH